MIERGTRASLSRLKISIITPSLNQGRFIERTVRSVIEQVGEFDLEYLVYDGGSSDETHDILRRYEDHLSWSSRTDKGQVDAINEGLRNATGSVVGWLNSDDTLRPGALDRVAQAFTRNTEIQWLHGRCDVVDENDVVIRKCISAYKHWRCLRYSFAELLKENFISQMTVFWRRSLLDRAGLLDPGLKLAFDYDLWLRFARLSSPLYVPERLACFRWHETSKSGSRFVEQFQEDYRVAEKYASGRNWVLFVKRLRTARILSVYRTMSMFRRLSLNKG